MEQCARGSPLSYQMCYLTNCFLEMSTVAQLWLKSVGHAGHVRLIFKMSGKELQLKLIKCPAKNFKCPAKLNKFSGSLLSSSLWSACVMLIMLSSTH